MINVSELIGKEAITLDGALKQGTVFNVYFDSALKECKSFSLIDNEADELKWVEYKNVLSFNSDAFVIRSDSDILYENLSPLCISPINKRAYNQDGKFLGIIRDIVLIDNKIEKFITDNGQINSLLLLSKSEEILVFNDSGKDIKIKTKRKVREEVKKEEEKEEKENEIKTPIKISQEKTVIHAPKKNNSIKYSFLLGKRLQKSVYDVNGKIIAYENDLISEVIINKAKENGKLVTLALYSL